MKKLCRGALSILLMLAMALSLVPAFSLTALAAGTTSGGTGSEGDPYIITLDVQLAALATEVNSGSNKSGVYYKLGNDISLSGYSNWTPIGKSTAQFQGIFDGDDKIISGLTINQSSGEHHGLFGYVGTGGVIKNLGITGCVITGVQYVGGIAGKNYGTITNCYNSAGNVSGQKDVGGIVGENWNRVTKCFVMDGNVKGIGSGGWNTGGVAGRNCGGAIQNCYTTATVQGVSYNTGGILGENFSPAVITNCYSTGLVSSTGPEVAGAVAKIDSGTVNILYYNSANSKGISVGTGSAIGMTPAAMQTQAFCDTLNANKADISMEWVWESGVNNNLPYINEIVLGPPTYMFIAVNDFTNKTATNSSKQLRTTGNALQTGTHVRLVTNTDGQKGAIFSTLPLSQDTGFSTAFHMYMQNAYSSNGRNGQTADGFVLIIAKSNNAVGNTGEGIGYDGIPNSIGIEYDTWDNSATNTWNGPAFVPHIALGKNGVVHNDKTDNFDVIFEPVATQAISVGDGVWRGLSNYNLYGWAEYDSQAKKLYFYLSLTSTRPNSPLVVYDVDLSDYAGAQYHIGFTSATGYCAQETQLKEWYVSNKYLAGGLSFGGNYAEDSTPPTKPTITTDTTGFTLDGSTDTGGSGVEKYQYKLDDGEWTDYTDKVSPTEDVVIYARAIDGAGNISEEETAAFTAPLIPQSIAAATYSTAPYSVNNQITATAGAYTANSGGSAGTHTYKWYRADDNSGTNAAVIGSATLCTYTPVAADFGKWICIETTPVGDGSLAGTPVKSAYIQIGVKLIATVSGNGSATVGGSANTVVYNTNAVNIAVTKTTPTDTVVWTASGNVGSFGTNTSATTTYTPPTSPTGDITLTATLTAVTPITAAAITVTAPVSGNAPVTTAPTSSTGYSCGTVSWTPNSFTSGKFSCGTAYTATVTLTASNGYTFTGLTTATINTNPATVSNNTGGAVTLAYTFSNTAAHTPSDWIIDTEATHTIAGSKHKECTVCEYITETEVIPAIGHSYGSDWETDENDHWHECPCGAKADTAAHMPSDWIVDLLPTEATDGSRHKECTVCGYIIETEAIPVAVGSIGGGIANDTGAAIDVEVWLYRGNDPVPGVAPITLLGIPDGQTRQFMFSDVPNGYFNVVAKISPYTDDEYTVTQAVQIISGVQQNPVLITVISGKTQSVVRVEPDTPPVAVSGLPALFANTDIFDPAVDQAVIDGGGTVEIKLVAEKKDNPADKSAITTAAGNQTIGLYMDLSVIKSIFDSIGDLTHSIPLTNLGTATIAITFELPASMTNKTVAAVYRAHGSGVDTLTGTANTEGEYFTQSGNFVTLHVCKFSTYALSYIETTTPSRPSGGGSGTTYYTVTFDTNGGGTVQSQSISRNSKATKPADPAKDGYTFAGWYSDKELTKEYDFNAAVTGNITIYAKWKEYIVTAAPEPTDSPVSDILNTTEHVAYVSGYPDGTFAPDGNISRAETVMMLYRLLINKNVDRKATFNDIPENEWYTEAVQVLAAIGIINGYPEGTFRPDDTITRAEFTAMITRFAGNQAAGTGFGDTAGHWAADAISTATGYGWINGYPDGTFRPDNNITRAEAVKIINAALDRIADKTYIDFKDNLKIFVDLTSNFWGYYEIIEAANAHDYDRNGTEEVWK